MILTHNPKIPDASLDLATVEQRKFALDLTSLRNVPIVHMTSPLGGVGMVHNPLVIASGSKQSPERELASTPAMFRNDNTLRREVVNAPHISKSNANPQPKFTIATCNL